MFLSRISAFVRHRRDAFFSSSNAESARSSPTPSVTQEVPRTFAEAPRDQGRGKAKDAMVELDRGNLVTTIMMRRVGVGNFIAAAPGGLEAQDCYYVGDDDSVSRNLRLATDVVWDASLKEAAKTKEKPLLVFQRLAIKRKLHLMVAAEAGYKIETREQIAMFENLLSLIHI